MTQEVIDVGVNADSGDGDSLYESGNKINNNFDDFFDLAPVKADIKFLGNNITSRLTNADIDVHPSGTGSIVFPAIRFNDNNIEALNSNDDIKINIIIEVGLNCFSQVSFPIPLRGIGSIV